MTSDQCMTCRHKWPGALLCDAFPEGIPTEIVRGEYDHRKPYEGDGGIRWERDDRYTTQETKREE